MSVDSETFFDEPEFYCGRLENLGFVIWHETPTVPRVETVIATFPKLERTAGTGFAVMAIVTSNCAPIGPEVRTALNDGMRAHRDAVLAMAAVIEVPGVLGGLTRAIARTLNVVARSPFPLNTYGRIQDASLWLPNIMSQRGANTVSSLQIVQAVDAGRRPR
ncbi:MAG: hypothetical protein K0V04_13160 [Deltaproteobacteria bacterium]|nr:hypothetical protein [Deltaproteobacteria bacterium]